MAPESFEVFWARERDPLYRALAVSLGDAALAADAVDEAMARALQHWRRVAGYDRPAAWVWRVAVNWATSWHRKWSRRPTRPAEDLDRPVADVLPDLDLHDALADLPDRDRAVLALRYLLDWTVPEVAAALDVPVGTAKSRIHRALGRLEQAEVLR